ncbi:MAG: hypothetical protein F7C37_03825 [Desulfurococcales archaeon]|nr:hypothetical protein [Desulfurococcales archaeon]MCE4622176.1 hypothetical protein [Desulfurococcales archaeon]MCE4626087.1 hypothetical protein [Desulfurococcales archaeon]
MASSSKSIKAIAEYAARFGLKPEVDEESGRVVIKHQEYPLEIVVEPSGEGYRVEMRVGDELEESISELLEDNVDPRSELEDVIETMVMVVDYSVRKLKEEGFKVERDTRNAILDVYDALESFLEEE